ncbi:MAG: carbonic anhydrase [Pseudomonadota bacterium]|nr:carbonic anhydrase [Pseudomonadota bacterium]
MGRLLEGHATFRKVYAQGERAFLAEIASGNQAPDAMFVGCSDSRVIPELLTNSRPGELFVVRNVANLVPPVDHAYVSTGAALEYAVEMLQVPDIIVCGHYGCGGVRAVIPPALPMPELPTLRKWLAEIRSGREKGAGTSEEDLEARWRRAVEANVLEQLANLLTYPSVERRVAEGTVRLHAWVYEIGDGSIVVYDPDSDGFVAAEKVLG